MADKSCIIHEGDYASSSRRCAPSESQPINKPFKLTSQASLVVQPITGFYGWEAVLEAALVL